jgi:peptidoglycan/LPS O-acetylase OafA/YrhL
MSEAPSARRTINYRPDIDGLRAVAVLGVMAFHTGILRLGGGYVGVDVFFVISGYLISSIVFLEIAQSRFSVIGFYERRIRRIFPALFALLFALMAFAAVFLLPDELVEFSKSLLSATFSASNFYFWRQSGYFDHRNSSLLLHTWSLAVEEQFYILFPIFLVVVRRLFPKRLRISVVLLFLASLIASAIIVPISRDTAFYMPYTRAWELLLGTMVALGMFPKLRSAWSRNIVAFLGLALILFSYRIYTPLTPFPGLSALVPCVGTALIIGAGEAGGSIVYSALALRPIVFLGLISYSLYLWHWAIIMIYRMGLFDLDAWFVRTFGGRFAPDRFDHLVEISVSLVLAILCWKYVEQPFRKGRLKFTGPKLFALASATLLLCVIYSGVAIASGGVQQRFSQATLRTAVFLDKSQLSQDEKLQRMGTCFVEPDSGATTFNYDSCLRRDPSLKNYLVLGDSHAAAIWPALQAAFPGVNMMQVNVAGCPSILDSGHPGVCQNVMHYILQNYLLAHPVDGLILESDWNDASFAGLNQTLAWLKQHDIPVIVIGNVPQYDAPLARLLSYSVAWNNPSLPQEHRLASDAKVEQRMRSLVEDKWHMPYISLYDALCDPAGKCIEYADAQRGIPMMDDSHHFNRYGAEFAIRKTIDLGEWNQTSLGQSAKKDVGAL